jgi:hypothetical protein
MPRVRVSYRQYPPRMTAVREPTLVMLNLFQHPWAALAVDAYFTDGLRPWTLKPVKGDAVGSRGVFPSFVIASIAKQSRAALNNTGLPRFARNDGAGKRNHPFRNTTYTAPAPPCLGCAFLTANIRLA